MSRLGDLRWDYVRHIELTVDRGRFRDGEEAFDEITFKRGVGNLVKNLERTDGVKVVDWVNVVEWHRDGFPHWHLFVEVERAGKAGMIGHRVIKGRWPFGIVVWETPVKSEEHWKHLKGYFDRRGYFGEGKGHQSELPQWAKKSNRRIKRFETMKGKKSISRIRFEGVKNEGEGFSMGEDEGKDVNKDENKTIGGYVKGVECLSKIEKSPIVEGIVRKTYEVILGGCGKKINIEVTGSCGGSFSKSYDVDYFKVKSFYEWRYIEGKGLIVEMDEFEYDIFIGLLDAWGKAEKG
jgi:hypothetical protein